MKWCLVVINVVPEDIPCTFTVRNDSRITDLGSLASYNLILENNLSCISNETLRVISLLHWSCIKYLEQFVNLGDKTLHGHL